MNYLELYKKWAKTGEIEDNPNKSERDGNGGLCNTVIGHKIMIEYFGDGRNKNNVNCVYWGAEIPNEPYNNNNNNKAKYTFNPLRQNMVLLLAAIHNQL